MKKPSLSVVIPNYNHGQYLPRALEAMLQQSLPADEILVIDDCSTDNSMEVLGAFADKHPHIRVYRNPENRGVVYSGNRGLELAQSEYVYFGSSDDEVLPGFFEKSLNLLQQHSQSALCCTIGDWREIASGLHWHMGVGMGRQARYFSPEELVALERAGRLFIPTHTAILRREVVFEAGQFKPELKWHCDWFVVYISAFRHGLCFIPEPLAIFYIHPTSFYTRGRQKKAEHQQVLESLLNFLKSPPWQDVTPLVRRSGALYIFGMPLLKLMLTRREFRDLITPLFLLKNVRHILKLLLKKITPPAIGNIYLKLAGYRTPASAAGQNIQPPN